MVQFLTLSSISVYQDKVQLSQQEMNFRQNTKYSRWTTILLIKQIGLL